MSGPAAPATDWPPMQQISGGRGGPLLWSLVRGYMVNVYTSSSSICNGHRRSLDQQQRRMAKK